MSRFCKNPALNNQVAESLIILSFNSKLPGFGAHICNNDLINKLKQTQLAQGAASIAGLDQSAVTVIAYKLAVDLPNSREAEFKADEKGLQYMKRAGYNQNAMPAFLRKLLRQSSQPSFLSSHPGTQERISVIERKIANGR